MSLLLRVYFALLLVLLLLPFFLSFFFAPGALREPSIICEALMINVGPAGQGREPGHIKSWGPFAAQISSVRPSSVDEPTERIQVRWHLRACFDYIGQWRGWACSGAFGLRPAVD
ncbi:hypothetical protein LZ30DRAFT_724004 [Colletotrichum cereale]|nr:hypothetical protein LZ30DRAFT_724004 [Colletotrichum cereale]